jgi:hypothetical protein
MRRVPLKEYKIPRILLVDFKVKDIRKIFEAGFQVERAFTGLDNNKYCIPVSIQDVEIAFFNLNKNTFYQIEKREKHDDSILDEPDFDLLIKEIWNKRGWSVIFVSENAHPRDLELLEIEEMGLLKHKNGYISASEAGGYRSLLEFPKFKGTTIKIFDDELGSFLNRFFEAGKWILMTNKEDITFQGVKYEQKFIITDDSFIPSAMAIEIYDSTTFFDKDSEGGLYTDNGKLVPVLTRKTIVGGIIILPDFGDKNVDVGLTLIQEYFYNKNPLLYSTPRHEWLTDYRPVPVKRLYEKRKDSEARMKKEIEGIDKEIEKEEKEYSWLDILLVGRDDDFRDSVGIALRFLGFNVIDVDKNLSSEERKREDFNIKDPRDNFFYIVEAKATKRGASEDFITKTQNHQGSYSRINKCPIPDAILIVNHSTDLSPSQRSGRFYTDTNVLARLKEQNIKAVDSISLHSLCQKILEGKMKKEKARDFIKNISGAISEEIKI